MAWPPGVLPVTRTNGTPQNDTHAADHNSANGAINDTVAHVQAIDAGTVTVGSATNATNATNAGHATTADAATQATLAYKIRSVDTPNDIELHWDSTVDKLYFRLDGGEWIQFLSSP